MLRTLQFVAIMLAAVAMAAGFAHLLALPNKIDMPPDAYLAAQQAYRGWALLGVVVIGALVAAIAVTILLRGAGAAFHLSWIAALCIAASLALFFAMTYPANRATRNWTVLPEAWQLLRLQWEYSHAVAALLYFVALVLLVLSVLVRRR